MSLITSRTVLSDRAAVGASARKIVNERAVLGAEAARESENTLSDLQATATQRIQKAVEIKSTLKNDTLRKGIVTSRTTLKSLKYSDFDQSTGEPSIPSSDLRPFKNTGASIGQDMTPDTKKGLGFEFERRKQDAIRLGKTMDPRSSPSAQKFLLNQTLVNQSVAVNQALKGKLKEAAVSAGIGAARIVGVTASAIAQAAGSGTGLRVIQGFVPLNGGYVVDKGKFGLLGAAVASLNPFGGGNNQISKANIALRGRTINDGFIQTVFEEAVGFDNEKQNTTIRLTGSGTFYQISLGRTGRATGQNLFSKERSNSSEGRYLQGRFDSRSYGKRQFGNLIQISDSSKESDFLTKAGVPSLTREAVPLISLFGVQNSQTPKFAPFNTISKVEKDVKSNVYLGADKEAKKAIKDLTTPGRFILPNPDTGTVRISDESVVSRIASKSRLLSVERRTATKNPSFSEIEGLDTTSFETYIGKKAGGSTIAQTTAVANINSDKRGRNSLVGSQSLERRFYLTGNTSGEDKINVLSFETVALGGDTKINDQDIIPFTIQNIPATGNTEFLYFRAYLDSLSDSYNGEWSGTRYIGRAEELYNYTGFKRGLQFSFKIAAHSPQELKPLYEKLNRLVGTTAPTYDKGLFMQGVFSKITIGDYVQKLPGFFTSVDLTWQTAYPWEIGNVDSGARDVDILAGEIPRVPHILDVSVSFQPVHDFAPQYNKTFIGFPSDTVIGQAS